ncbi:MAG: hypothetical protein HKO76_11370, partial [Acidimicrobiia bacterium]|nr:hypothetical protein [Acidimicrobiia bacterium]
AVFPLNYLGDESRYGVLGRGLSELVVVDLAHVRGIDVVERIRLQALLHELALSESERVDPSTAPRVGRLLGAGRIVGGSFDVLAQSNLRLDVALWDSTSISSLELSDDLDNLFRLANQLVFDLLKTMGIEPSHEEIERIEFVPTRNLQAFIAFCRGLALEDQRDFEGAARQFSEAVALDPAFGMAAQRVESAEGMNASGPTTIATLHEVKSLEAVEPGADLLDLRLQNLGLNLRMNLSLGLESREPATEIVTHDGELPDPPPPPPR